VDHRELCENDDVDGHSHVDMAKEVLEVIWLPVNVGIKANMRDLKSSSNEEHGVVLTVKTFSFCTDTKPAFDASSWAFDDEAVIWCDFTNKARSDWGDI
jgi:hypothetical protein